MSEEEQVVEYNIEPAEVVNVVQQRRMQILMQGTSIDKDELALMRDLAKTAVDNKRIEVDQDLSDSLSEMGRSFMGVVNAAAGSDPFKIDPSLDPSILDGVVCPEISEGDLPEFELLETETSLEPSTMTYSTMFPEEDS